MSKNHHRKKLRHSHRRRVPPGTEPGTLTSNPSDPLPELMQTIYSREAIREFAWQSPTQLQSRQVSSEIEWINLEGVGNAQAVQSVGNRFGLHLLAMEDVVNPHQRPKFDDYQDHLFLILRMPVALTSEVEPHERRFQFEQVALAFGRQFVVTFQEFPGDTFDSVRKRLRSENSLVRTRGSDYLVYSLLDSVVDAYFPILEHYGELVEELEVKVVERPTANHILQIHALKRDLLSIRRALWPMRDLLAAMSRDDSPLITDATRLYLRDCHDHTIQLLDMVETYREIATGLIDVHLSSVSNRLSEVMKVLTIIATIFIPLTFISGIYGMNFDTEAGPWNMPELKSPYGYVSVLVVMALIATGLVAWFYQRGWLGQNVSNEE
ncbi:MAG: magnesium/cobalt transporter CorA [Planctomycetaceae bacterium]|nr:magnesium/cobalt transporter CorA [Planctomycetaceae bacterium]